MKVLTKDLIGPALDWMVAECEGELYPRGCVRLHYGRLFTIDPGDSETSDAWHKYGPSTDWAQGGPIIEREGITLRCGLHGWDAELEEFDAISHGPTPLIAAMRCYCCAKLGEFIDIPEELCQQPNN